jgi:hypothetical protein
MNTKQAYDEVLGQFEGREAAGKSVLLTGMTELVRELPKKLEKHPKVEQARASVRGGRMLVLIVWKEDVYEGSHSDMDRLAKEVLGPNAEVITGAHNTLSTEAIYPLPG